MPPTPPSQPRSNVYQIPRNPEERTGWSTLKPIVITAAVTAVVGVAAVGAAVGIKNAVKRGAQKLFRRQEAEQQLAAAAAASQGYQYAPPPGYVMYPSNYTPRDPMPDALRDIPPLVQPPVAAAPSAAPPIVVGPSPEILAEIRKMGSVFDRRLGGIEKRIAEFDLEDDEDYDDEDVADDDEDEEPEPKKGKRR